VNNTYSRITDFAIDYANYEIFEGVNLVDESKFALAGYIFNKVGENATTVDGAILNITGGGDEGNVYGAKVSLEGNKYLSAKFEYTGIAGLMIKDGEGRYNFIRVNGNNYESYGNLDANGGIGSTSMGETNGYVWLKVTKKDNRFETAYSLDGQNFTTAYSREASDTFGTLSAYDFYIYAISGTARVSAVVVKEATDADPDPIGSVLAPVTLNWTNGSTATSEGGKVTVTDTKGGWEDNYTTAMSVAVDGHYQVTATLKITGGTAGIMIVSGSGAYHFVRADNKGNVASYGNIHAGGGTGGMPCTITDNEITLRLTRKGDFCETSFSADGKHFTVAGTWEESEPFGELGNYTLVIYAIPNATVVVENLEVKEFCKSYIGEVTPEYGCTSKATDNGDGTYTVSGVEGTWEDGAEGVYFTVDGDFIVTAKAVY
ncbi:MAG: hypothetical protein MJ072_05035, partial [Clostridia bacterium]|nr:hypothetical protein [Clostridia bacterium]